MSRLILGVDFDGTVVTHRFPEVGQDAPHAVEVLKELQGMGFLICLNTMRSDKNCYDPISKKLIPTQIGKRMGLTSTLEDAVDWFERNGITLDGVNTSPGQRNWTDSPKVYATHYIDDMAVGCPMLYLENGEKCVDWLKVKELILGSE